MICNNRRIILALSHILRDMMPTDVPSFVCGFAFLNVYKEEERVWGYKDVE